MMGVEIAIYIYTKIYMYIYMGFKVWGMRGLGICYPNNGESMEKNMENEMETGEYIGII